MRIGRFADPEGATFWALIDPAADTVRRIDCAITQWAAAVAAEHADELSLHEPEPPRPLPPVDPSARVFGWGRHRTAGESDRLHQAQLGVDLPQPHYRHPPTTNQLDYQV